MSWFILFLIGIAIVSIIFVFSWVIDGSYQDGFADGVRFVMALLGDLPTVDASEIEKKARELEAFCEDFIGECLECKLYPLGFCDKINYFRDLNGEDLDKAYITMCKEVKECETTR